MAHADANIVGFGGAAITTSLEPYNATGITIVSGKYRIANGGTLGLRFRQNVSPTYQLVSFALNMPSATLDTSEVITVGRIPPNSGTELFIRAVRSGSGMKMRFRRASDLVTGTTEFALGTDHDFLVEADGTNLKLHYLNGSGEWVEEMTVADTAGLGKGAGNNVAWTSEGGDLGAGETFDVWKIIFNFTNNRAAVQDGNGAFVADFPSSQGNYDEWGDQTDCTSGSTTGDEARVDDWATGNHNGTTDYNCEFSSEAGRFTVVPAGVTVPTGFASLAVIAMMGHNVPATSKTMAQSATIYDGTNTLDQLLPGYTGVGDQWFRVATCIRTAADAGAWSRTDYDNTEFGLLDIASNPANNRCTAICVELCGVGTGTFAAAAQRLATSGVSFGSANVGII